MEGTLWRPSHFVYWAVLVENRRQLVYSGRSLAYSPSKTVVRAYLSSVSYVFFILLSLKEYSTENLHLKRLLFIGFWSISLTTTKYIYCSSPDHYWRRGKLFIYVVHDQRELIMVVFWLLHLISLGCPGMSIPCSLPMSIRLQNCHLYCLLI